MKIWLDGCLCDRADAKISVFDHGLLYGDGVFEGLRIYDGKIFQRRSHVDRLFASAESIRLTIPYTPDELTDAMYASIQANNISDGYIRLVVTRGNGTLGLNPFLCPKSSTFIIADKIALYEPAMYETGLSVIIAKTVRCSANMLDPMVKSLNYLNNIRAKIEGIDAGVLEVVMLNQVGNVAECSGDNLFIVENSRVITPPPDAGILVGITRQVVMDLARKEGIEVAEENISPERLLATDECFLTGTAAEVIAVTKIDETTIGSGQAGPFTSRLLKLFRNLTRNEETLAQK